MATGGPQIQSGSLPAAERRSVQILHHFIGSVQQYLKRACPLGPLSAGSLPPLRSLPPADGARFLQPHGGGYGVGWFDPRAPLSASLL
jgi:hypothetical protein